MLPQNRIQHPVDKRRTVLSRKLLGQLDGFVNDHFRRGVGRGQLPGSQAEDAAIDRRLPARRPLWGETLDLRVERLANVPDFGRPLQATQPSIDVLRGRFLRDPQGHGFVRLAVGVPGEEDLQCDLAAFPFSRRHDPSSIAPGLLAGQENRRSGRPADIPAGSIRVNLGTAGQINPVADNAHALVEQQPALLV